MSRCGAGLARAAGWVGDRPRSAAAEVGGHPGRHRAGDQQPNDQVPCDGRPFHDEHVRDRGVSGPGEQAAGERTVLLDRHVHRGVAFHRPGQTPIGLSARRPHQPFPQEEAEQQVHESDHQRSADELSG